MLRLSALMAGHNALGYEIRKNGDWGGANHRTHEQRLANGDKPTTIKESAPIAPRMSAPAHLGQGGRPAVWIVQKPITDIVFPAVDDGHERKNDVVQGASNYRRKDIATEEPRKKDSRHCFEADNGNESEKNSNRDAARDRVRRIANRQQLK